MDHPDLSCPGSIQESQEQSRVVNGPVPVPEVVVSSPAQASDSTEDNDIEVDVNQDDACSVLQPAISLSATRLTASCTPAADKLAALAKHDARNEAEASPPSSPVGKPNRFSWSDVSGRPKRSSTVPLPTGPAIPIPGKLQLSSTAAEPGRFMSSMSAALQSRSKHRRTQSAGESALKRLSKALPSLSFPTHLKPSSPTSKSTSSSSLSLNNASGRKNAQESEEQEQEPSGTLHRSASDESLVYQTLSRVTSYGEDERFAHVREQVNVRVKAIMDTFEGASFRLPQMSSILNAPLKRDSQPGVRRASSLPTPSRTPKGTLDEVLEDLTGDVVILGGYRGSILRSAKPPHRRLWVPVKVQLGVRKVNLEVGLDDVDEENMTQHIIPDGMLQHIGPVDIARRLFKRLRESPNAKEGKLRVHDYGYDWRLSPHRLSKQLVEFLEKLPCNSDPTLPKEKKGALVIAHSLGGLIVRHAVNQRPELFSGVVYAGTPQRCINILGPLRNGDPVLLNEKLLTAQVNFSLRTTFVFLPEDGFCFVDKHTKEEYRVDFYNVDDWIRYRFCPCVSDPPLPPLSRSTTLGSLLSLSDSLSSLPLRKNGGTNSHGKHKSDSHHKSSSRPTSMIFDSNHNHTTSSSNHSGKSPSREQALDYLRRVLSRTRQFRQELTHNSSHQSANLYPPHAVIYSKSLPTTYAAQVASREAIAHADAYDDLLFKSGDGVVLAKESMLPEGYKLAKGGKVQTDRGHIGLLGDLEAVGWALKAVVRGRKMGVGLGLDGVKAVNGA